jgi:microcystin-dependent protein
MDLPIGTIMAYAGSEDSLIGQKDWKICNGQKLPISDFPKLYRILANHWGDSEDEENTDFQLPDLRGLFLRGVNGERSDFMADPDKNNRKFSSNESNSVGSLQEDAIQEHQHRMHNNANSNGGPNIWGTLNQHPHNRTFDTHQIINARVAQETRPKNAYVHWIIKVK